MIENKNPNMFIKRADDDFVNKKFSKLYDISLKKSFIKEISSLSGLFGKENIYIAFNNESVLFAGIRKQDFSMENCTVDIIQSKYCLGKPNAGNYDYFISFILYECFFIRNHKKIFLCAPENNKILKDSLENNKFNREGALEDRFYEDGENIQGIYYTLTKESFNHYSVGYIKVKDISLCVTANNYSVISVTKCDEDIRVKNKDDIIMNPESYYCLNDALDQLSEYFGGKRKSFDIEIQVYSSTEFQKKVWNICKDIPYGNTFSYEEVANMLSEQYNKHTKPFTLSRAVGLALSKNPLLILIPCHRVIGKDGKLRGFAAGVELKDYLLNHEMSNLS